MRRIRDAGSRGAWRKYGATDDKLNELAETDGHVSGFADGCGFACSRIKPLAPRFRSEHYRTRSYSNLASTLDSRHRRESSNAIAWGAEYRATTGHRQRCSSRPPYLRECQRGERKLTHGRLARFETDCSIVSRTLPSRQTSSSPPRQIEYQPPPGWREYRTRRVPTSTYPTCLNSSEPPLRSKEFIALRGWRDLQHSRILLVSAPAARGLMPAR